MEYVGGDSDEEEVKEKEGKWWWWVDGWDVEKGKEDDIFLFNCI